MTVSEWVALLSPLANIIVVAIIVPAMTNARNTHTQLAVLQYQVRLLLQKNGIDVPEHTLPSGHQ